MPFDSLRHPRTSFERRHQIDLVSTYAIMNHESVKDQNNYSKTLSVKS